MHNPYWRMRGVFEGLKLVLYDSILEPFLVSGIKPFKPPSYSQENIEEMKENARVANQFNREYVKSEARNGIIPGIVAGVITEYFMSTITKNPYYTILAPLMGGLIGATGRGFLSCRYWRDWWEKEPIASTEPSDLNKYLYESSVKIRTRIGMGIGMTLGTIIGGSVSAMTGNFNYIGYGLSAGSLIGIAVGAYLGHLSGKRW